MKTKTELKQQVRKYKDNEIAENFIGFLHFIIYGLVIAVISFGFFYTKTSFAQHELSISEMHRTAKEMGLVREVSQETTLTARVVIMTKNLLPDGTDLDRLSYAVAMAETHNCERETNFTVKNNCHGIILSLGIARYNTTEESHDHFKDIWTRLYGRYPDRSLAEKWTGKDRTESWLQAVDQYYNQM